MLIKFLLKTLQFDNLVLLIISSHFCCYFKFNISMFFFFLFLIVFKKTELFINLKNYFSKLIFAFCLSLVFISIHGFNEAFWLNLITLWTFFKINPWFNSCFTFLMWMTYWVLSCKLVTSFSTFRFSFSQVKMVNHCEIHVIFKDIEYHLRENILHHFLHYSFEWNLH